MGENFLPSEFPAGIVLLAGRGCCAVLKNAPKHEELMQEMEMGGEHEHNGEHE